MNFKKLIGKRVKVITDNHQEKAVYEGVLTGYCILYSTYTLTIDDKILICVDHIVSVTVL